MRDGMNRIFRHLSAGAAAGLQRWRRTALSARLSAYCAGLRGPGSGWGKRSRTAALGLAALFATGAAALLI